MVATDKIPAVMVVMPVNVLVPDSVSVFAPVLVRPPAPLKIPPSVIFPLAAFTVRVAAMTIARFIVCNCVSLLVTLPASVI